MSFKEQILMKKFIIPAILLVTLHACTSNDDPQPVSCQPTKVEYFDVELTTFLFDESFNGINLLSSVTIEDGTSMTYEYTDGKLDKISITEDDLTINYTATYDGDRLVKLSGIPQGFGIVSIESRLVYNGDRLQKWEDYLASPTDFSLYQFQHYEFEYSSGDLANSKWYIDDEVILALGNGTTPSGYSPGLVVSVDYGYDNKAALNPLFGFVNVLRPELSVSTNIPITQVFRDANGNVLGSSGYDITYNDQGYPTQASNPDSYINIEYDCN